MGCLVSTQKSSGGNRRWPSNVGEIAVFVPGLRIPKLVDFAQAIGDGMSRSSLEILSALRTRTVGVDIQLGIAINSVKATMAVKRRLACEIVKYWHQAHENIADLPLANGWEEKHKLFIQWKLAKAKAAAYYYHGIILEEGNAERYNAAQQAAEEFFKESKKAAKSFHNTVPLSRNPPLWGTSKFLSENVCINNSSKLKSNDDTESHEEEDVQMAPELPDFALSLKGDEYKLPLVDPSWNGITCNAILFGS